MIAFERAFAGRSVAMSEITDNPSYRKGMPRLLAVDHVPYFSAQDPQGSLDKTMNNLEMLWKKHGSEYAGLTVELIQGEAGFLHGSREYFNKVFKWAKEHQLYIWVDGGTILWPYQRTVLFSDAGGWTNLSILSL